MSTSIADVHVRRNTVCDCITLVNILYCDRAAVFITFISEGIRG